MGRCRDSWWRSGTFGKETSEGRRSSLLDKQVRAQSAKGWGPGALGGAAAARGPVKGKWTRATSCWLHGPRTPAVSTARCAVDMSRAGRRARAPGCEVGGWRRVLSLLLCTDLLRREDLIGVGCQEILPQTEFSETLA